MDSSFRWLPLRRFSWTCKMRTLTKMSHRRGTHTLQCKYPAPRPLKFLPSRGKSQHFWRKLKIKIGCQESTGAMSSQCSFRPIFCLLACCCTNSFQHPHFPRFYFSSFHLFIVVLKLKFFIFLSNSMPLSSTTIYTQQTLQSSLQMEPANLWILFSLTWVSQWLRFLRLCFIRLLETPPT